MKTTTSIKLDTKIKKEASALANELGLSLSSVINATLKQFVTERRVVLSVAPEFNERTKKAFLAMEADVRAGKNISEAYTNVEDLKKALLG
ncbi:MAG TPA: type II toxin-antitoxin system RelB/DinJ family antitoxin [Candidatus Paceibacterota bacterium]|nr:type II toxin-antitoxin system RelB/DinJ family antitoxin [Candidatus Paceibacterota bacterium]HMO83068.1 type II toxin-antitoxin system RelB/DinJ family antitoxin [Candidatus Paceibacterota bacterium]